MSTANNKVIVILGPTSSGKSEAAIWLAKKFGGEIISADSRQIYLGMNIGTGKIKKQLVGIQPLQIKGLDPYKTFLSSGIAHYLIDIVNPKMEYNVSNFKKDAEKIIVDILRRGKLPIICGGTGFWIKAIVDDVSFPEVKPNKMLRNMLRNKAAEELFKMLKKIDPGRAETIDAKNKVRLIRAIEICKKLGKVPSLKCHPELVSGSKEIPDQARNDRNWKFLQIGIDVSKGDLHKNIKKRLKKRFQSGMINEVEKLKKSGLSWKKIKSFGLGYFWIPLYLKNEIGTKKELFEKVYQAEKDYAKRQLTWFRKDQRIVWLKNYKNIGESAQIFIKK